MACLLNALLFQQTMKHRNHCAPQNRLSWSRYNAIHLDRQSFYDHSV